MILSDEVRRADRWYDYFPLGHRCDMTIPDDIVIMFHEVVPVFLQSDVFYVIEGFLIDRIYTARPYHGLYEDPWKRDASLQKPVDNL